MFFNESVCFRRILGYWFLDKKKIEKFNFFYFKLLMVCVKLLGKYKGFLIEFFW